MVRRHQEVSLSVRPMSSALAGRDGTSRSSKRASGVPTRRRLMPSSQVSAIGFAPTRFASPPPGPLPTPGCMMNSPAPLPSRATGFFTLGTQRGGVTLVRGGSRRFTESHLASVRKNVLDADTIFIPDPNLPRVESGRLRKQGTEGCSGLGGGSRLAEMPKQG
jgi:hypothetical protein